MAPPAPPGRAPIETKTQAAGLAGVVAGAVIWILQQYVFKGTVNPGLVSLIYAAVPGVLAFAAAYLAPHTPRPVSPASSVITVSSSDKLSSAQLEQIKQDLATAVRTGQPRMLVDPPPPAAGGTT